jgi:hypothetical protein
MLSTTDFEKLLFLYNMEGMKVITNQLVID